jgi:hypothetical protein
MDECFEENMKKMAYAHMADMTTHFKKYKQYPTRAFCYDSDFNIKHFSVDQDDLNG